MIILKLSFFLAGCGQKLTAFCFRSFLLRNNIWQFFCNFLPRSQTDRVEIPTYRTSILVEFVVIIYLHCVANIIGSNKRLLGHTPVLFNKFA